MNPNFEKYVEMCTIDIETFDHEMFANLIVQHMMTHLAAHALSQSTAMEVYVQWSEIYEGNAPEKQQQVPDPGFTNYDF